MTEKLKKLLSQHLGVSVVGIITDLFSFLAGQIAEYGVQRKCGKTVIAVPRRSRVERTPVGILGTGFSWLPSSRLFWIIAFGIYNNRDSRVSGFVNVTDQRSLYSGTKRHLLDREFSRGTSTKWQLLTIAINFHSSSQKSLEKIVDISLAVSSGISKGERQKGRFIPLEAAYSSSLLPRTIHHRHPLDILPMRDKCTGMPGVIPTSSPSLELSSKATRVGGIGK
ncbi:unnamed protein product [Heterotrigona itama]|uniref:Uncharacterized protein n=1 Tax=Heterotrigona itama TaxID=395501 RepID=A0A6V7H3W2_9HYME|nr:unnamed protein product [Heterotrigona itama]